MKLKTIDVTFRNIDDDSQVSITLYSKFTCIFGKNSGEGKTHFYNMINEHGIFDGREKSKIYNIAVDISDESYTFQVADTANIMTIIASDKKLILFVDEIGILSKGALSKISESKNILVIGITRQSNIRLYYPYIGIYRIEEHDNSFDLVHDNGLRLLSDLTKKYNIVTESCENRSEHEFLSMFFKNIVACNGANNIHNKILGVTQDTLVFADLGNISQAYSLLRKRCYNSKIVFYNYMSFEQLLYESGLVDEADVDNFSYIHIEKMYEKFLERANV